MATAIDFPATLPAALSGTLQDGVVEAWTDDQSEIGSPRRRARWTRSLERFSYSLILTEAQLLVLRVFYETDLSKGVLSFNWTRPGTGAIYEVLFSGRPQSRHMGGLNYSVSISLEEI